MPENTLLWTENARPTLYGQCLAWQITTDHSIDPAEGVEPVTKLDSYNALQPEVIIKSKKEEMEEARKDNQGLVLWTDASNGLLGRIACKSWLDLSFAGVHRFAN